MESKQGKITGMHHVCIYTSDIDQSIAFYKLLGFRVIYKVVEKPEVLDKKYPQKYALIRLGNCSIELLNPRVDNLNTEPRGVIGHIGFNVENIEALHEDLKRKGIKFNTEDIVHVDKMYNGIKLITFKGPSGEGLTLYEFNDFDYDNTVYENLQVW